MSENSKVQFPLITFTQKKIPSHTLDRVRNTSRLRVALRKNFHKISFPQNFYTSKLSEILAFYAVLSSIFRVGIS